MSNSNSNSKKQDIFYPCQLWSDPVPGGSVELLGRSRGGGSNGSNGDISSIDLTSSSCSTAPINPLDVPAHDGSSRPLQNMSQAVHPSSGIDPGVEDDSTDKNSKSSDGEQNLNGKPDKNYCSSLQKRISWKRILTVVTLAVLWAYWRRKRILRSRKDSKGRLGPSEGKTVHWLFHYILSSWNGPNAASSTSRRKPTSPDGEKGQMQRLLSAKVVPVSLLLAQAKKGNITKALVNNTTVAFCLKNKDISSDRSTLESWHKVKLPFTSEAFQSKVLQTLTNGGCEDIGTLPSDPPSWTASLATPLAVAFPFLYLMALYKMMKKLQDEQQDGPSSGVGESNIFSKAGRKSRMDRNQTTSVRFENVAGLQDAKIELMEVVQCLRHPKLYQRMGARSPRGVLLYGPTGTGKTLLARAVAGEASCSATFVQCSASDFCEMWVGRGAARVRHLFRHARSQALSHYEQMKRQQVRQFSSPISSSMQTWTMLSKSFTGMLGSTANNPTSYDGATDDNDPPVASAIIFIDEIDALAKTRSGGIHGNDEREQTLNQLLIEMDGFVSRSGDDDTDAEHVTMVVMAATNRPDILDPALLRPGRFDRHVYVGCPSKDDREQILRLHARKIQLDLYSVDLEHLSRNDLTGGFTGAEISNLINEAAFLALRSGLSRVTQVQLIEAAKRVSRMKHGT